MAELKYTSFAPRWMRDLTEEDAAILDSCAPNVGSIPEGPPRLFTRIVPRHNEYGVPARTLSEVIEQTQTLANYSGCDLYHGFNPDFADLRSASAEVLALSRLTVEPFEEGSFVILARLDAAPVEVGEVSGRRRVTTQDVANRFVEMLVSVQDPEAVSRVSIGALQAIEGMGRIIRREAGSVEYHMTDKLGQPARPVVVDADYLTRLREVRASRQPTRAQLDTLAGKVTAIDMVQGTFQLTVEGIRRRVKGTFSILLQPSLLRALGRHVRLEGIVERRAKTPVSIQVLSIEIPDDEA
jgi:hypothetical protein